MPPFQSNTSVGKGGWAKKHMGCSHNGALPLPAPIALTTASASVPLLDFLLFFTVTQAQVPYFIHRISDAISHSWFLMVPDVPGCGKDL